MSQLAESQGEDEDEGVAQDDEDEGGIEDYIWQRYLNHVARNQALGEAKAQGWPFVKAKTQGWPFVKAKTQGWPFGKK